MTNSKGVCGIDPWGPWEENEFTNCFREVVIDAGIPLLYSIGSLCILISTRIRQKRKNYERLLDDRLNQNYGSIEQTVVLSDDESDADNVPDIILVPNGNKIFDYTRLLVNLTLWGLFGLLALVRRKNHDEEKHGDYWLITPVIEAAVWMYATVLALINLTSRQRNILHIRGHLDILNFLTFISSLFNLYSFYLNPQAENTFVLWILALSSVLVAITILEPPDVLDDSYSKPNAEGRFRSPELKASIYEQFMFSWINPLINKGFRQTLTQKDVYELPSFNQAKNILKVFHRVRRPSFLKSLFCSFRTELTIQLIYSVVWSILNALAPPYFLEQILRYVQNYPNNKVSQTTAYLYVVGLFLGTVMQSFCFQQSLHIGRQICIKIKAVIIGEVYLKSLSRKDTSGVTDDEESKNKTGKITNLMAVDALKVSEIAAYFFYLYSFPIQITISMVYLYSLLGVSAFAGVLTIMVTYPLPSFINQRFEVIHKRLMTATDKRMGVMNELLQAIRIIKFFAWEKQFRDKVMSARDNELKEIKNRLMQWVYLESVWISLPLLIMLSVFMTYTKFLGNELSAPIAFTALALFSNIQHAVDEFPATVIAIIQARVSINRIEEFLSEPEVSRQNFSSPGINDPTIGFRDASFQWPIGKKKSSEDLPKPTDAPTVDPSNRFTLQNLNTDFPVGELSIICGPTGCGKTSLLMALLGELECLGGRIFLPRNTADSSKGLGGAPSGIAYVAQTAWLQNATIQDNILFGLPYNEETYNTVLKICALNRDLEIFEFGDKTEIGEKGITLSGGQKQRIALARAVYSQAKIILLDDCLSAVDAHTSKHIYEQCLMGDLMKNRTRILVTHHVGLCLRGAAKVIVIKDGQVIGEGSADKVLKDGLLGDITQEEEKATVEDVTDEVSETQPQKKIMREGDGKLIQEESKAEGSVEWKIYKVYFKASGGLLFWMVVAFVFLLTQALEVGRDWWIREWTKAYTDISGHISVFISKISSSIIASWGITSIIPDSYLTGNILALPSSDYNHMVLNTESDKQQVNVDYYIFVYVLIGLCATTVASFRSYYVFTGSLVASRNLHGDMLEKILYAKFRFFDTTPIGRIMNRFSKDMETIDQELSPVIVFLLYSCIATASVIFVISCVIPQFLIAGAFIAAIYVVIGAFYIATSRDLKRLESVNRSPIYAAFGETIIGVSTIRAFGAEKRLIKKMLNLVDGNNRPFIFNWSCNRWLHIRVDIAGGLVSLATGVIIIYSLSNGMDPGLAGFTLTYALNFTGHVVWVIRMYALQELNMNAGMGLLRVHEYLELEEEPPRIIDDHRPPSDWPSKGDIQVKNLVMQYTPESPAVLINVSFNVRPSEKIGIVGRTGSGKSTLAMSFFRFIEATSGQIIIDDVDISKIGLFDLRSKLTIIPQDPVLFSGTLRSNLDLFGEFDDDALWNAIRRAHLVEDDSSKNNDSSSSQSPTENSQNKITWSLDSPVSENGSNFSQGQRQLIALARALVRRSKVIIMDEATASVDFKTDRMIQETIRQEFGYATLLCIAHHAGKVVEFDHPYTLLTNTDSIFREMCERTGEFGELLEIAKARSEQGDR
ncbi:8544_t:CDS:10, partial [Ambispora gerdemannii]